MSKIVINNTTRRIEVHSTGRQGAAGLIWRDEGWALDAHYQRNQALEHNGSSYRVLAEHVATAETEPGVGADWEAVWEFVARGSNAEDVSTVAGIAPEIVAVASIKNEVEAVAAQGADIGKVVANLPAIQAAPQAATDAANARDKAAQWAEGTEPDGPGTKSSREHALDAASSATAAQSATLVGYGVSIYKADGVDPGGYYADRRAANDSVQDRLYVEIIDSDPGSEAEINVEIGGETAYGPVTVTAGTPVDLSGLSLAVTEGDAIGFLLVQISSGVRELFAKTYGAVA